MSASFPGGLPDVVEPEPLDGCRVVTELLLALELVEEPLPDDEELELEALGLEEEDVVADDPGIVLVGVGVPRAGNGSRG